MACVQACGSAEAYHGKHKSLIDEIVNKAHHMINKHCHDHGALAAGRIHNLAKGNCIKFLNKHDWSGKNKEHYPCSITKCHSGNFVHSAHCHGQSDEAAVVYSDECGSAYLLAWSVKDHCGGCGNPNKVHVECGPIENYQNINWCAIKAKLDKSCDTSYYVDRCSGNEAFAKISKGNKATLVALYSNFSC